MSVHPLRADVTAASLAAQARQRALSDVDQALAQIGELMATAELITGEGLAPVGAVEVFRVLHRQLDGARLNLRRIRGHQ